MPDPRQSEINSRTMFVRVPDPDVRTRHDCRRQVVPPSSRPAWRWRLHRRRWHCHHREATDRRAHHRRWHPHHRRAHHRRLLHAPALDKLCHGFPFFDILPPLFLQLLLLQLPLLLLTQLHLKLSLPLLLLSLVLLTQLQLKLSLPMLLILPPLPIKLSLLF